MRLTITYERLSDVHARFYPARGRLVLDEDAGVDTHAMVLADVAAALAGGRPRHARRPRHLQVAR